MGVERKRALTCGKMCMMGGGSRGVSCVGGVLCVCAEISTIRFTEGWEVFLGFRQAEAEKRTRSSMA